VRGAMVELGEPATTPRSQERLVQKKPSESASGRFMRQASTGTAISSRHKRRGLEVAWRASA
jgi:hypothetical protein